MGRNRTIKVTGGGAYKYADLFRTHLNAEFERVDEMEALITGTNFLLSNVPNESFTVADAPVRTSVELGDRV